MALRTAGAAPHPSPSHILTQPTTVDPMRVYHERLRVPATWWVAGLVTAIMLGTAFIAQFSWQIAAVVYLGLGGIWAAAVLIWGWTCLLYTSPSPRD